MFVTLVLATIPVAALYLYRRLCYLRFKQFAGYPQAEPSLLWGHMLVMDENIKKGHPSRHSDEVFLEVSEAMGSPPAVIFDIRPVTWPILVIMNHEVAEQITRSSKAWPYSAPKSPTMDGFSAIIGKHAPVSIQGEHWKTLRKRFNPGFAPQHLMTLLPAILDKTRLFLQNLDQMAKTGEEFHLGAVIMNQEFNAQIPGRQDEVLTLFKTLAKSFHNDAMIAPRIFKLPIIWRRRQLGRKIDALVKSHIRKSFAEMQRGDGKGSRSVMSLSLQGFDHLTDDVVQQTCDNLKTFLFAGHDTTSVLLQWAFYELSRTPSAQKALRDELDEIFGPDSDPAVVREKLLSGGEEIMRRMEYTSAVIKEVLRLHPPAGSARFYPKGSNFRLALPDGKELCADNMVIYICETIIQRDPAVYGETRNDFVPERWLVTRGASTGAGNLSTDDRETAGSIPAAAWRPFERGPRHCIGQELANIEARVILASAVRRYDFTKVGLGELELGEDGVPIADEKGVYKSKSELFNVTAKPADSQMRVRLTEGSKFI